MNRIFLSLALTTNVALAIAMWYGLSVRTPSVPLETTRHAVSMHLLIALGASLLVLMMHAVVLTYFMGTGRWIEDTSSAYRLDKRFRSNNVHLKFRVIPGMLLCMLLVIITGAFGAASDPLPGSTKSLASTAHFLLAISTLGLNVLVSWAESTAIRQNGQLVADVVQEVRRIRKDKGLDP